MQENNIEQPPSLSQLLRESYLAEARAQQRHSEMSRSDASSSRLQIYGSLKGKAEDPAGHNESQFPDLSAFLSQEELDKSVNLARQAIGHEPREDRAEVKTSGTPPAPSNASTAPVPSSTPPSVPFANPSPAPLTAPTAVPFSQQDFKEVPATHTPDAKIHKAASARQDNLMRNNRESAEGFNDLRSARNAPYGPETQSKKEFLNKAADFIEELSSLFKANSSKRVRPRSCKAHRSRSQAKSQGDGPLYPLSCDDRERSAMAVEAESDGPGPEPEPEPADSLQADVRLDSGIEQEEFQDCRITEEQQFDSVPQEAEGAESCALTEAPGFSADPACEPPRFIQKLKSREVPEGSKVQLDCIVRGLPVPEVRWFCEGKELENSPDIQIITNGELHSLIIAEAFEEDTGRYSCFASNFYGTDSTSAEIYIEGASSSDSDGEQHFEHVAQLQKKQLTPAPTSSQTLSSDVEESPLPTEAVEVLAEETPQVVPEPLPPVQVTPAALLIPEVSQGPDAQPAESDTTALEAFPPSLPGEPTEAQEVSTTSTTLFDSTVLPVTPQPLTPSVQPLQAAPLQPESQTPNHSFLPGLGGQHIMAAPVFTKTLQELLASEGQLVVLECRVKGMPSPRVDWYQEGKIIEDSPDFRILQKKPRSPAESEEICTLVIAEVFPEDSGMFTCTASNKYGTVSSTAALRVKGNGSNSNHVRPLSATVESNHTQDTSIADLTAPPVKPQSEVTVTNSIKPHSSTIRLDPLVSSTLRLDPLSTSTLRLDPHSSSMLRPDPLRTSLPSLDPTGLTSGPFLTPRSVSTPNLDPHGLHQDPPAAEQQTRVQLFSYPKPYVPPPAGDQDAPRPSLLSSDTSPKVQGALNHQNGTPVVVPLPDPPPTSCLKKGKLKNHRNSRSGARVGLRVHFKLPEDEEEQQQSDTSSPSEEDLNDASASKEPPPVLAKPKLDPAQLQLLHNQVLMEQQQETEPPAPTQTPPLPSFQAQSQAEAQSSQEGPLWSPRMHHGPQPQPFQPVLATAAPPLTSAPAAPAPAPAPALSVAPTHAPPPHAAFPPAPPLSSPPSVPPLRTPSLVTSPPPVPHLSAAPVVTQMNTIHSSHLNLSPAALGRAAAAAAPGPQLFSPPAPKLTLASADAVPITSPAPLLRSTHASLMNLSATSQSFGYARPKAFIAAQTFSPVRSPSPTESPVPLLHELAAELNSSAASSPTLPPFSPPPTLFPTRVLSSPTSSLVSSPTPNSVFAFRAQSPPQAASPTSSSSTPSPIQNPVAFLSAVLPSLSPSQPTNSMGLPRGAPLGANKKVPKFRLPSTEDIRESKETLLHDIEKKLRFRDESPQFPHQQKLIYEGKTASRPLGPNIPATVINYDEEYKVSSFEQRLMSEIEFRLERTPVEESDDEVQHDDIPTGKCIAPIFDKKLKNFRAMEGVPVTFSCKVVGIPIPKVYWFKDGKQILRKNVHYKKIREGDGTCALHIEATTNDDDGNYTIMAANPQVTPRFHCFLDCLLALLSFTASSRSGTDQLFGPLDHPNGTAPQPADTYSFSEMPPPQLVSPSNNTGGGTMGATVQSRGGLDGLTDQSEARVRTRIQEVEGEQTQERFFRPHFLQAPGDMLAHEGRLCRLDCKVSGLPNPELMWLVNGQPIYPDLTHRMLVRENGVHSLVIDPLSQNDAGTYTCIASNKAGQSSFCLELKVVEREMKHPPQFVEKLQNMGIPEGTPVRLECRVVGMPPPLIFWKKDNETVPKNKSRISMQQDATGYVCLLIQPTTKDDAGWYTVSAKNEAGIVSCTCRLDIYAQWHQSVPAPMKKAPRTGSRYAALTGQGLDIKSAFPTSDTSPILFSSSPPENTLESEEL